MKAGKWKSIDIDILKHSEKISKGLKEKSVHRDVKVAPVSNTAFRTFPVLVPCVNRLIEIF